MNEKLKFTKEMLDLFALYLTQELGLEVSEDFKKIKDKEYSLSLEQRNVLINTISNMNNFLCYKMLQSELKEKKIINEDLIFKIDPNLLVKL
jgi:hypothetical protein